MDLSVTNFPFFTYIQVSGKPAEEFIRINKTVGTFTYKERDYEIGWDSKRFIKELEGMSEEFFELVVSKLDEVE